MRRLLPFLLVPAKNRSEVFMKMTKGRIGEGTRACYWVILMSLEGCLRPADRAPDEKKINTKLQHLSQTEAVTIIRPPCTYKEIDEWTADAKICPTWAAAMIVTFLLGQRLSDVGLLQTKSISIMESWIGITFLEGKTIPYTGPYTIHVERTSRVAANVMRCIELASRFPDFGPDTRIFLGEKEEYHEMSLGIHCHMDRDVRCLRRGGLQGMALLGLTTEEIQVFSRHASVAMLTKYLQNGRVLVAQAAQTSNVVRRLEASHIPQTLPQQ
jgi:integrase